MSIAYKTSTIKDKQLNEIKLLPIKLLDGGIYMLLGDGDLSVFNNRHNMSFENADRVVQCCVFMPIY